MTSPSPITLTPETLARRNRNRLKLVAILAVCAAPVIASYFTYYVIKPDGRTNYGELVEPQRPAGALKLSDMGGASVAMDRFRGKWVLMTLADKSCDKDCAQRLYVIRQVRLTTGKDRDRIERALLITDQSNPDQKLLAEHDGLQVMRVDPASLAAALPQVGADGRHPLYVVDPLGNVMMRFSADADPSRMKKDISKLLRASRVG